MQNDEIINQAKQDWAIGNQQALKHCIVRANESMFGFLADYPAQKRISTIRGIVKWDLLDHHFEALAGKIFDGITASWEPYRGAKILQLNGNGSCVIAKHVLEADDDPIDSDHSFRMFGREQNQMMLTGFDGEDSHNGKARVVLVHGGFGENAFAFLKIYFKNVAPIFLTENIMHLPDLDSAAAEEFVEKIMPQLKPSVPETESEILPAEPLVKLKNVISHS